MERKGVVDKELLLIILVCLFMGFLLWRDERKRKKEEEERLAKAKAELAIAEEENRKDPVSIQKRKMVLYWHNNVERLQSLLS